MKQKTRLVLLVIAAVWMSLDAFAHSPMDKAKGGDLTQLVEQSNLVFSGRAAKVAYRNARGGEGEGEIPYTIVTYRIEKVLRGKSTGDTITLRFVGGPDGRGRFLTVTGVPVVQEGDRDVLFVGNPDDPSCPLVFCEHGRYRVLNEQVYDTYGSPVRDVAKNKVLSRGHAPRELLTVRYPAPKFDDLMKNPEVQEMLKKENISIDEARSRYEREAPKVIEAAESYGSAEKSEADSGDKGKSMMLAERNVPVSLNTFMAATEALVKTAKRSPVAIRGLASDTVLRAAKITLTVPKQLTPGKFTPAAPEMDEYKAYENNGFNPVIRKPQ
jgi:hypothetical protein